MAETVGSLKFAAAIDLSRLEADVKKMEARLSSVEGNVTNSGGKAGKGFASGFSKFITPQTLGITALSAAVGKIAADSVNFSKEFKSGMTEVATISQTVTDNFQEFSKEVIGVSLKPIKDDAIGLSKAYYQIVSAGHDGAAGIAVLEAAAKAATGGVTETTIAADGLTTVMNAWGKSASDVDSISDKMFTTVRLGKTSFGELSASIAQVAPLASSSGIAMDQIFAAVASLTKQGTPTAQAMTQIRSSIINMTKVLGDGWSESMTYQEGLAKIAEMAGGSQLELRKLIPDVEGMNAVLGLTGEKAAGAAADLEALANSTGAADAAFNKMSQTRDIQVQNFKNNLMAAMSGFGSMVDDAVTGIFSEMNEAFANGSINEFFGDLAKVLKIAAAMMVVYNSSTIATTVSMAAQEIALKALIIQEQVLTRWTKLTTASQVAYNAAGKGTAGVMNVVGVAAKSLWATMAANPFGAIIAVIGLATAAYFAFRTKVKDAAAVQEEFNRLQEDSKKVEGTSEMISRYEKLAEKQTLTNTEQQEYNDLIDQLSKKYPDAIGQIDEHGRILSLNTGKLKEYNEQQKAALGIVAEQQLKEAEKSLEKYTKKLAEAQSKTAETYTYTYADQFGGLHETTKTRSGKQRAKAAQDVLEYSDEVAKIQETIAELRKTLGLETVSSEGPNNVDGLSEQIINLTKNLKALDAESLKQRKIELSTILDNTDDVNLKKKIEEALGSIDILLTPKIEPRTINKLNAELKELESQVGSLGDPKKEAELQKKIIAKNKEIEAEWLEVREAMYGKQEELQKIEVKKTEEIQLQNKAVEQGLAPMKTLTNEEREQLDIIKKKIEKQVDFLYLIDDAIEYSHALGDVFYMAAGELSKIDEEIGKIVSGMSDIASGTGDMLSKIAEGGDGSLTYYTSLIGMMLSISNLVKDTKDNLWDKLFGKPDSRTESIIREMSDMFGATLLDYPGVLKDIWKSAFGDFEELYNEVEEGVGDLQKKVLGFDGDSITDSVIDGLKNGFELGLNDLGGFEQGLEKLIQNAALEGLKASFQAKYMEPIMNQMYDAFEDSVMDESEREDIEKKYREGVEGMQMYWDSVKHLFEEPAAASQDTIKGSVQGITEQTAGRLEGSVNSIQYNVIALTQASDKQLAALQRIASNTDKLEDIKINTKNAAIYLEESAKQVKQESNDYGL